MFEIRTCQFRSKIHPACWFHSAILWAKDIHGMSSLYKFGSFSTLNLLIVGWRVLSWLVVATILHYRIIYIYICVIFPYMFYIMYIYIYVFIIYKYIDFLFTVDVSCVCLSHESKSALFTPTGDWRNGSHGETSGVASGSCKMAGKGERYALLWCWWLQCAVWKKIRFQVAVGCLVFFIRRKHVDYISFEEPTASCKLIWVIILFLPWLVSKNQRLCHVLSCFILVTVIPKLLPSINIHTYSSKQYRLKTSHRWTAKFRCQPASRNALMRRNQMNCRKAISAGSDLNSAGRKQSTMKLTEPKEWLVKQTIKYTLPKTNIFAPTNVWLEYYFPIGVPAYFQGLR